MSRFDFDKFVDRSNSCAMKYYALYDLFGRKDLTPFWIADMEFEVTPEISEALDSRFSHRVLGYESVPPSFKESIISWLGRRHNLSVSTEAIAFVPGIVRGIGYAINYFTRPGDAIVIQPPVYHPFRLLTEGNGRVVINNPLVEQPDGGYKMNLTELEEIFATRGPKMMILCNPHNPAGLQWSADTLRTVASLAKQYGVMVVSDEIHGDLMLWNKPHIPFSSVSPEAAEVSLTFGAPSKTFNIAGLASSWMLIPNPALREGFFNWMEVNEFSTPTFPAVTATIAAYNHGEQWLDEVIDYIEGNIMEIEKWFAANLPQIKVWRPESSFLIWLDCRGLQLSHKELISLFVNEARLALNDGGIFGKEGIGFMRLNAGHRRKQLLEALESLKEAVNHHKKTIAATIDHD